MMDEGMPWCVPAADRTDENLLTVLHVLRSYPGSWLAQEALHDLEAEAGRRHIDGDR